MIAFPGMLVEMAERAGIKVPSDPDWFDKTEYPHFNFFCDAQLGQPMPYAGCHWDNAVIVASIPEEKLKTITWNELVDLGFAVGFSK